MKILSDHTNALEVIEFFEQWLAVIPPHWKDLLRNLQIIITATPLDQIPVLKDAFLTEQARLAEQMKQDGILQPNMQVLLTRGSHSSEDGKHTIFQHIPAEEMNEKNLCFIAAEIITAIGKIAFSVVNIPARAVARYDPHYPCMEKRLGETASRELFGVFFLFICFPKQARGKHCRKRARLARKVDELVRQIVENEISLAA